MVTDLPPPFTTVVFDCDSTLSSIEGICELAGARHAAELATLTSMVMDGEAPLEEVYGRRLEIVRPTRNDVQRIGERYIETLLPNVEELVGALRFLGKRVAIVSGGLLPSVTRLAVHLGIEEVYAVGIHFHHDGSYAGFEETSPLARAGGKPEILRALGDPAAPASAGATVLIGDGTTDLEAAPWVARFVAFGGVERREAVFAGARVTCEAGDFRALVPLLFSQREIETLRSRPEHRRLLE